MLQSVDVGERSIDSYRGIAPDIVLDELTESARDLRGARVLHVNATPYGGGVSELLRSVVPLQNALGIVADWRIINGDERFFTVTKKLHDGLQGRRTELTEEDRSTYEENSRVNASLLQERYDVIFVHDPQPAAILPLHGKGDTRWVWRCHIDTSQPDPSVWDFLRGFIPDYDAAVFTMREFVPPSLPVPRVAIIPPAIDPLSPKNLHLPGNTAAQVLDWIGIRTDLPLVTQVSRFDPWKDPMGVIESYRIVRSEVPNVQLALVGSMALDDPEGWGVYQQIREVSAGDPLIHLFTNLTGVGNIEVNAFQRESDVVVQKSIREGFGLVVSEALWKQTPVVAGRAGGIPLQMADGVGGHLVEDVEECAAAILNLIRHPAEAASLGREGRERVRRYFLLPRLLLNELALLSALVGYRTITEMTGEHDPVCGIAVKDEAATLHADYEGRRYTFCSQTCMERFLEKPERWLPELRWS